MTTLDSWLEAASAELGLTGDVPARAILDLARDVAHQVERPAAPLTAFVVGLAVGQGQDATVAISTLQALAARWAPPAAD